MSDLKPSDLLDLDALLSDEERQIRDLAREWVHDRILPEVEDWYERGEFPARELAKELGELGFFGMQLPGIGDLDEKIRALGSDPDAALRNPERMTQIAGARHGGAASRLHLLDPDRDRPGAFGITRRRPRCPS